MRNICYQMLCLVLIIASLMGCNLTQSQKGDRILMVTIADEKDTDVVSEIDVVRKSLNRGGSINVNVSIARKIDPDFDNKYALSDSKGMFQVIPAILNWVGGHGWRLVAINYIPPPATWTFVKS